MGHQKRKNEVGDAGVRRHDLGRAIRGARERASMTRADLAERLSITESYMGMLERGEAIPTLYHCRALSQALPSLGLRDLIVDSMKLRAPDEEVAQILETIRNIPANFQERLAGLFVEDLEYLEQREKKFQAIVTDAKCHQAG